MKFNLYLQVTFLLSIMLTMTAKGNGQRVVNNNSGEQVIMYPDGTWRKPEPGDSTLLKQYSAQLQGRSSIKYPTDNDRQRNKGEEYDFLLRQWNGLYLDLMAEEKEVQDHFRHATNAQFKASEELATAEANKKLVEPDRLASLQEAYDASINHLRTAKLQQKEIKSLIAKTHKINGKPESISQGKINRIKTNFTIYLSRHQQAPKPGPPSAGIEPSSIPVAPEPETVVIPPTPKPTVAVAVAEPYDAGMVDKSPPGIAPTSYNSQPYLCEFDTDTIDQATGRRRLELHPELLFTYTDPDLRPFFKSKDLITSRIRLSKIGPYIYIAVEFQIASSHSQSNFGTLAEGSLLRFRLMNGEYVSLYNLKAHSGRIDPYSGYTIFTGQYALGKTELKKLNSAALDNMRVLWSTGFEDYDIYKVDLLIDQIHCIESKQ